VRILIETVLLRLLNLHFSQWLTTHAASAEHDIGGGLRENFNARARWRSAIAGARALNRFSRAASPTSSNGWRSDSEEDGDERRSNAGSTLSVSPPGQSAMAARMAAGGASPKLNGGEHPGENEFVTVTAPDAHEEEEEEGRENGDVANGKTPLSGDSTPSALENGSGLATPQPSRQDEVVPEPAAGNPPSERDYASSPTAPSDSQPAPAAAAPETSPPAAAEQVPPSKPGSGHELTHEQDSAHPPLQERVPTPIAESHAREQANKEEEKEFLMPGSYRRSHDGHSGNGPLGHEKHHVVSLWQSLMSKLRSRG
jgi:calcium/calmodulin-dependent protein kinase I